jgi:hypothetical protein
MQTTTTRVALCLAAMQLLGCGGTLSDVEARQQRERLRDAMNSEVATREQRDDQSRLLADVVATGALDGLSYSELRAAFGPGQACRSELCSANGFAVSDWFYDIGRSSSPDVKQVPVLIIGFDSRGRVGRVFTFTTH